MSYLRISYNGKKEDLLYNINRYQEVLQNSYLYMKDFVIIRDKILNNFDEYKDYSSIFLLNLQV